MCQIARNIAIYGKHLFKRDLKRDFISSNDAEEHSNRAYIQRRRSLEHFQHFEALIQVNGLPRGSDAAKHLGLNLRFILFGTHIKFAFI